MVLSAIVLVLLGVTTAVRLPTVWRDRRQRALWLGLLALTLTTAVAFPPVAGRIGVPTLPHLLGVVAAYCLLRFVSLVTGGRPRPWQLAATGGVLVALVTLQLVAGGVGTSADVLTRPLTPAVVGYWVVLEAYLGAVLVIATVLFWTVGRAAPAGLPRLGLRVIAGGLFAVSLSAAGKSLLIVVHGCGVPVPFDAIEPVAHVIQAAAVLLTVAGATVPAARRARTAAGAYRSLLVLRPLWRAMRDAFPEIILFSPRRAVIELAGVDDVHLRLYRRVIEIRDGMLALRDFVPEHVPAAADPAVTEARAIVLALRRRAAGTPAQPAAGISDEPDADTPDQPDADDPDQPAAWAVVGPEMADEVAWLRRVSAAYRRAAAQPLTPDAAPTPRPCGSVP